MVWNTIISIITCRSVWSITILARFITQTNSDDTNPPSYFWKQYIYNGDRRPWAQIDEISQTGWGPLLKIMRKFACVKLLLQLWCENPISNLGVIRLWLWLGLGHTLLLLHEKILFVPRLTSTCLRPTALETLVLNLIAVAGSRRQRW